MNRRLATSLSAAAVAAAALLSAAGSGGAASAAPAPGGPLCLQINIVDAYDTGKLLCP